jgi:SSS family solute:Na+ symporter
MNMMPAGVKGLIFAALVAAIVSSIASMTNSISTIFTMDLYANRYPGKSQHHYVFVGRITSISASVIAMITAQPLLGQFDQAFQYIQEFTGFFTPGIVTLFILGMFWKRTTANGGLAAAIGSAVFSISIKYLWPELPFMDRVGVVFVLCMLTAIIVSISERRKNHEHAIDVSDISFATEPVFNVAALATSIVLISLYSCWW